MKRKLVRWGIIASVCAVVVIPAIALLSRWMSNSSEGTVQMGTPTPQTTEPEASKEPVAVDTSFFSTSLPGGFTIKRKVDNPTANPLQLELAANTSSKTDQQFSATIGTMPVAGLSGIGDYNLRTTDTATYAKATPPQLPTGAVAFQTISGPAALTIFWARGIHYAELSFTTEGGTSLDSLQATYTHVISAWNWK
jgi:hypothetical protein